MAERILVLGPSWVGDMVLAHSLFQSLKARDPHAYVAVAAPGWTLPLLSRMPEVDEAIALPFKHGEFALGERIRFGQSLRDRHFTQAILLVNSFKSAILPLAARIPIRTGFLGEFRYGLLNDIRPLDKASLPRTVDRFCVLGLESGEKLPATLPQPRLVTNPANAHSALQKLGIAESKSPVLALCPGAEYGSAKRWPEAYYAEVANRMLDFGWQVWLFGSEKDRPVTATINRLTQGRCQDLSGRTSLGEAIDLMALASAVVSNDSGLMHVAAALQRPLVAVYGSSDPSHTPPMSNEAKILSLGLSCSPCFKRECPLGHLRCLREITPAQVIESLPTLEVAQRS
ncbi:heptosyltransferase II [Novimethylophilus kurashikiensis]|uniref:lipopolysaccharide heptosyltransferase II n=1 Tax=Novimethylophilus kurashikiensis TaxID=1825523 RepID=A0A2R5F786_9PROT|nr:lipopolysaccharide heptosyltransferase II [Novimethylophilus kurashikiensis]GBG13408.1 heptosyltransferase II [Novimethylophilus kurashikiensis]